MCEGGRCACVKEGGVRAVDGGRECGYVGANRAARRGEI